MSDGNNATIHTFKPSGKWYATGRGKVSPRVYINTHDTDRRRQTILEDNGGACPGLRGQGRTFTWVVIPDEDAQGFPLMLRGEE